MAMKVVLVALAAFVVVTVEGHYCCTPRQYEVYQGSYAGMSAGKYAQLTKFGESFPLDTEISKSRYDADVEDSFRVQGLVKLSIDADKQKVVGSGYVIKNGVSQYFRYIRDFKNKRQYYITKDSCSIKRRERPFTRCVPDDVIETGSFTFGMDTNIIKARYFNIKVPVCQGHVLYIASVAPIASRKNENLCVPISETALGFYNGNDGPVKYLDNIGYINITDGIEHEEVFDIPPQCNHKAGQDYWERQCPAEMDVMFGGCVTTTEHVGHLSSVSNYSNTLSYIVVLFWGAMTFVYWMTGGYFFLQTYIDVTRHV